MVYQFKIQLKNISNPTIWRRLLVPSNMVFDDFHIAIQIAFGWSASHLYFFSPKGYRSSPIIESYEYGDLVSDDSFDSFETELSEILTHEKQTFEYLYDFGDDWKHIITLEKILPVENIVIPQLIKGKGACPPENCGGPWSYMDLREIVSNRKHPEYKKMRKWIGLRSNEVWDADEYSIETHQQLLNECFS